MNLESLRERLAELNTSAHDIKLKAEAEKRDLTAQEATDLDRILDDADRCAADIQRLERLEQQTERLNAPQGRKTKPAAPNGEGEELATVPAQFKDYSATVSKNGGFKSLGEFAFHVSRSAMEGGVTDPRLQRLAPTTYGNEASGADGGFAVPPDFRAAIMEMIMGEESLLPRCDQINTSGNTFTCPADETTPWQTSGGIQAYWAGEGATVTQSKPSLQERSVKLNKLMALVPMTEELLEDASAMDSYLRRKAPEKIAFKLTHSILHGTGVGQPLGILNSPAKIEISKETSQVADTLVGNNVIKMYSRMYGPSRSKAVWLINQLLEPQLYKLSVPGTDNEGNAVTGWGGLVYMPAGGLSGSPFGTLFGRPVIPTQACSAPGDVGDIIFADFSQYLALLKSGPNPRVDVSMHLYFDTAHVAFRFILRVGGMPWWSAAASTLNGSSSLSPYVTLAAR